MAVLPPPFKLTTPPPVPKNAEHIEEHLLIEQPRSQLLAFLVRIFISTPLRYLKELVDEIFWTSRLLASVSIRTISFVAVVGTAMGRFVYLKIIIPVNKAIRLHVQHIWDQYEPILRTHRARALASLQGQALNKAEKSLQGIGQITHTLFTGVVTVALIFLHLINGRIARIFLIVGLAALVSTSFWLPAFRALQWVESGDSALGDLGRQMSTLNQMHLETVRTSNDVAASEGAAPLMHLQRGTALEFDHLDYASFTTDTKGHTSYFYQNGEVISQEDLKANHSFCRLKLEQGPISQISITISLRRHSENDRLYGLDLTSVGEEKMALSCWSYSGPISISKMLETVGARNLILKDQPIYPLAGL